MIDADGHLVIGLDIGGTKILAGAVDQRGQVTYSNKASTNAQKGADHVVNRLVEEVESIRKKARNSVDAVGVGTAGQVNKDGRVLSSPNLPFEYLPLESILESRLALPVVVTNDVRAATFGEWKYGAGRCVDDLVVLFVGTGIGGGVVSGGRLLEGCSNSAGELGHITLVTEGRKCRCPNRGCIEAYAGGWAIAERAQEAVTQNPAEGKMLRDLAGSVEDIDAGTVSEAWMQGDPLARKLVEETGRHLGAGAVGIVNAFNPCMLILGGGVIEGIPELIPMVEEQVQEYALKPNQSVKVVKASFGGYAGVIGAAALAREKVGGSL